MNKLIEELAERVYELTTDDDDYFVNMFLKIEKELEKSKDKYEGSNYRKLEKDLENTREQLNMAYDLLKTKDEIIKDLEYRMKKRVPDDELIEELKTLKLSKHPKNITKYDTREKVNAAIDRLKKRITTLARDVTFRKGGNTVRLSDTAIFDMMKIVDVLLTKVEDEVKLMNLKTIKKSLKKLEKLEIYKADIFK